MRAATDRRHKNAIEMINWNNFSFVVILWSEYINMIPIDLEKNTDSLGNIGLSKRKKLSEISLTRWLYLCWISSLTYSIPRNFFCEVGTHLLQRLAKLQGQLPDIIGDFRGKGLLIGMEMVTDKIKERKKNRMLNFLFE
jgi:hypothetical protein